MPRRKVSCEGCWHAQLGCSQMGWLNHIAESVEHFKELVARYCTGFRKPPKGWVKGEK